MKPPLFSLEACVIQPALIDVENSDASEEQIQQSQSKLLSQHEVLVWVRKIGNSLNFLKLHAHLRLQDPNDSLVLKIKPMLFSQRILNLRRFLESTFFSHNDQSLLPDKLVHFIWVHLFLLLLLEEMPVLACLSHQIRNQLRFDTMQFCCLFLRVQVNYDCMNYRNSLKTLKIWQTSSAISSWWHIMLLVVYFTSKLYILELSCVSSTLQS